MDDVILEPVQNWLFQCRSLQQPPETLFSLNVFDSAGELITFEKETLWEKEREQSGYVQ